jgi:GNAT superfamily N-acetyltransferase
MTMAALDNPVWSSLTAHHAAIAQVRGLAARYPADVSPFGGVADPADPRAWADLAALVGPAATVAVAGPVPEGLPGWVVLERGESLQYVHTGVRAEHDPEVVALGGADVPVMLDLVARTRPGPFRARTVELGRYYGLHAGGRLVAMAGERLHPSGWVEISAVCTDEEFRGQGLATRLTRRVAAGIAARGERPFLHTATDNTAGIRLYDAMGFTVRRRSTFTVVRTPSDGGEPVRSRST